MLCGLRLDVRVNCASVASEVRYDRSRRVFAAGEVGPTRTRAHWAGEPPRLRSGLNAHHNLRGAFGGASPVPLAGRRVTDRIPPWNAPRQSGE